ncbi:MAG: neocarzinostatin apoprotein domain-containing protein [Acidimicrobiales bacterium]
MSVAPKLVVTPSTDLHDGETVHVAVSNWPPGKAWISECASAADVNRIGCGVQLAQQPFAVIEHGSGSTTFTVRSHAATGPLTSQTEACTARCVVVAAGDAAATGQLGPATAPISFAP